MALLASKRKRGVDDMPNPRTAPSMGGTEFDDQYHLHTDEHNMGHGDNDMGFAAVLTQHNADLADNPNTQHRQGHNGGQGDPHDAGGPSASDTAAAAMAQYHTMTVPQSTEQSFMTQANESAGERAGSAGNQNVRAPSLGEFELGIKEDQPRSNVQGSPQLANSQGQGGQKPQVGTEEWHKVRRDNHKEVERRRRETINEGITELSKVVPGCEKNKGSILGRAVQFITQLKENETQNIEKWTLEKLLTEQAIAELSSSCDKLKAECQRAWAECEQWKKAAQRAGVSIDDEKGDVEDAD